jgi:hypothetical protein
MNKVSMSWSDTGVTCWNEIKRSITDKDCQTTTIRDAIPFAFEYFVPLDKNSER